MGWIVLSIVLSKRVISGVEDNVRWIVSVLLWVVFILPGIFVYMYILYGRWKR